MLLFLSADSPEPKGRKAVVMLTLRKLKEMVESPKKGEKKPSCKSLREGKCPVVAQKIIQNEVGEVTITVYKNGYVVYQAQNRVTVFPIEDISGYRYSSVAGNGYGCDLKESYFEEAEWYLRFVLRGEDRLSINLDALSVRERCEYRSATVKEKMLAAYYYHEDVKNSMPVRVAIRTLGFPRWFSIGVYAQEINVKIHRLLRRISRKRGRA